MSTTVCFMCMCLKANKSLFLNLGNSPLGGENCLMMRELEAKFSQISIIKADLLIDKV